MKKLSVILLIVAFAALSGCAAPVQSIVSDKYPFMNPHRMAVLPVVWEIAEEEDETIGTLFRAMTVNSVTSLNFTPLRLEEVDRVREKYGGDFLKLRPEEASRLLDADSLLYIRIKEWKSSMFLTYAYLKVSAAFELYSRDGTLLWSAEHSSRESDVRLDRATMELAVVKAYEPRIQRFVTAVFTTLPPVPAPSERKTYYEWLP